VFHNANLGGAHSNFCEDLSRASYRLKWSLAPATAPATANAENAKSGNSKALSEVVSKKKRPKRMKLKKIVTRAKRRK
jgi:hypothetical protein